ncbi:MAG: Fur family transcriptional regulator [Anaerolineae bacterium]
MDVTSVVERMRAQGYKLTPQRLAIVETLALSRAHPTAYELYEQVRPRYPMMGLATVYKTLEMLRDMGEVVETGFGSGGARFEANLQPHINLVCQICGQVMDIHPVMDDPDGPDETTGLSIPWVEDAAAETGFELRGGHIEFFGVCAACRAKMSSS